jgi:hypothetical protein
VRRRIAKAAVVFGGIDVVAGRLYTLLTGLDDAGPQGKASLAEFNRRVGDAYMVKWQLLSSAIDHLCRCAAGQRRGRGRAGRGSGGAGAGQRRGRAGAGPGKGGARARGRRRGRAAPSLGFCLKLARSITHPFQPPPPPRWFFLLGYVIAVATTAITLTRQGDLSQ